MTDSLSSFCDWDADISEWIARSYAELDVLTEIHHGTLLFRGLDEGLPDTAANIGGIF
jgi:hypothetical protein